MSYICFFDRIPIELLHELFTYFFVHEILHSFSNLSEYIDNFLLRYSSYRLNLQSIQISDYNLICYHIRPEQIIYLKLSDNDDTPGLSEHFFSQFPIEQFTQLKSFKLSEIEITSLEFIFSNLHKLIRLRSLSFNHNTTRYSLRKSSNLCKNEINRIISQIHYNISLIIPQLNYLHLNMNIDLQYIQFSNLIQLKFNKCSIDNLKKIFLHASLLKSLDITIENEELSYDFILTSKQLIRLNLIIKNTLISIKFFEKFLSKLINLKYLILETYITNDILNVQQWEKLINHLIIFNFKFYLINYSNLNLNLFRTSFWLKEKHWFVGLNSNSIFSIPYFISNEINFSETLFIDSTSLNNQIFYDKITKFTIKNNQENNYDNYFKHIKILNIKYSISFSFLLNIIDLTQIEQLSIQFLNDILIFKSLITIMSKLNVLSINKQITKDQIKQIKNYQFKQIKKLIINFDYIHQNYIIHNLSHIFPSIKYLTCLTYIISIDDIINITDEFTELSHASFYSYSSFLTKYNRYCLDSKLFISKTWIFKSQIYSLSNNSIMFQINLWLKEHNRSYTNRIIRQWKEFRNYIFYIFRILIIIDLFFFLFKKIVKSSLSSIIHSRLIMYISFFYICLFIVFANSTRHLFFTVKFSILIVTFLYCFK